jgi:hypothetical protein
VFSVSEDRLPTQLGDLSHITFGGTRNGRICPGIESWLESLELSHFQTMSKNDFMNLIDGYVISYDCCCHHHVDANELLTYMLYFSSLGVKFDYVSNKGSHFRWWDPRAALPTGSERPVAATCCRRHP